MPKFKPFVLQPLPECGTFAEALRAMSDEIDLFVASPGGMSRQHIETACWIEGVFESGFVGYLLLPDAFYFAALQGILGADGEFADPMPDVPMCEVELEFRQRHVGDIRARFAQLAEVLGVAALLADATVQAAKPE